MKIPLLLSVMCLFLVSLPCGASTVCVRVLETGLSGDECRLEASIAWENTVMGGFFDAGMIVSNVPACRASQIAGTEKPFPFADDFGVSEARENGFDLLVLLVLDYEGQTVNAAGKTSQGRPSPRTVRYQIKQVADASILGEGSTERLEHTADYSDDVALAAVIAREILSGMKER